MAFVIKHYSDHEAIAAGWRWNSRETLDMLSKWADKIIIMQPKFRDHISEQYLEKVECCDVGEDQYFHMDQKLVNICGEYLDKQGLLRK